MSDGKLEHLPERGVALHAEGPAERVVDEGEASVGVAANDDVALVVEQVAVAASRSRTSHCRSLRDLRLEFEPLGERLDPGRAILRFAVRHDREQGHAQDERAAERACGCPEQREGQRNQRQGEEAQRHPHTNPAGAFGAEALPRLTLHF